MSRDDLIQIEGTVREIMAGGQFRVESKPGDGTMLQLNVPLNRKEA